jgi:hypothetical protein
MKAPDINDRARLGGIEATRTDVDRASVVTNGQGNRGARHTRLQSAPESFPFSTSDEAFAGAVAKPWLLS